MRRVLCLTIFAVVLVVVFNDRRLFLPQAMAGLLAVTVATTPVQADSFTMPTTELVAGRSGGRVGGRAPMRAPARAPARAPQTSYRQTTIIQPAIVGGGYGYGGGFGYSPFGYGYGGGNLGLYAGLSLGEALLREQQRSVYMQQQLETQRQLGKDAAAIDALQREVAAGNARIAELQKSVTTQPSNPPAAPPAAPPSAPGGLAPAFQ
jgi:hypothetical protein